MSLVNPYCTVQQLRDYLRNSEANPATLEDAITAASRWIDVYKRTDYIQHDHTVTPLVIDKWNGNIVDELLFLPYRPIITMGTVTVAGVVQGLEADFTVKRNVLVKRQGKWPEADSYETAIHILGLFGYAQASQASVPVGMPAHISQACIQIAGAFSRYNTRDIISMDGSRISVTETDIPRSAMVTLGARKVLI